MEIKTKSKALEGLNSEQEEAVTFGKGPVLIVAGAGTGKTTVITRRIAYLIEQGVKPEAILAMAFGEKAAAEMSERVDLLLPYGYYNLQISTFHSFCERILKAYGLEIGLPDFKVLDEVGQWLLVRNNLDKFDLDYYRPLGNPTRFIRALVSHFARCKDELITPEEYLEHAEKAKLDGDSTPSHSPPIPSAPLGAGGEREREVANAYHVYQRLLLQSSVLDFGDLINYLLELLKKRPQILEKLRQQYEHILIDEFQDTNFAQYELLKLLAAPQNNLTVVGDDDQSIFKFRGASISNILHFQRDYPKAKFIALTQNYRSGQKILDTAYEFIQQNNPDRLEVKLKIDKKLIAVREGRGTIEHYCYSDYLTEASGVVNKILEIKNFTPGVSWNEFAILARSHEALEPFLNFLEESNLPYIYFANRGLYKKPIILDIISYFKLLDNYHESGPLYRVMNLPVFEINHELIVDISHFAKKKSFSLYEALKYFAVQREADEGLKKVLSCLDKHGKLSREKSVGQVFAEAVSDLGFAKFINSETLDGVQNGKYLEQFSRKIQSFLGKTMDRSLRAFMQELDFEIGAGSTGELEFDPETGPEAVKLLTAHGAKGLEFANVFIVGLVDKRFPTIERREEIEIPGQLIKDILPEGDVHTEEERRLCYVAMTRARDRLYLTRALDYGGKFTKKPSRFLIELGLSPEEKSRPTGRVVLRPPQADQGLKSLVILPVPKYFSFSQISLFRSCPLGYKYRYVLGLPAKGAANLSFGSTIHKTFEKYLRAIKNQGQEQDLFNKTPASLLPKFEILEKFYREAWIDDWYEGKSQMEEFRKLGGKILKIFYDEIQARPPKPKFLEASFRLRLAKGWFAGKIDRADETPEGIVIIDYKTGAPRGINKVDREQLLIYQWAAAEYFKEQVADLQYWFLRDKLVKESFLGETADLKTLKAEIESTVSEILETVQANNFYVLDQRISHDCAYRELEI